MTVDRPNMPELAQVIRKARNEAQRGGYPVYTGKFDGHIAKAVVEWLRENPLPFDEIGS